ncbi:hypothetical protein FA13DRAFT_1742821 [Coprinellus micaceus]|uniref:Uncharacterized protein n=1 Tax=Coprinellus micaceus TaxID=71717 RepID=A0A4Y7SF84_COPMI|nr:hypothetical protein FA13DRAFT_1742821 [Coprinellus micaceus]
MASSGPGELADLDLRCLSTVTRGLIEECASAEPRVEAQPLRDRVRHLILQLEAQQDAVRRKEEIRILKSAWNSLVPVARLPPEVLGTTFLIQRYAAPPAGWGLNGWLYLTHVCRHWRNTAMECAELWTTLDCTKNLDLAEMMFHRSKNAPLSVTFNVELYSRPQFGLLHRDLRGDGIFNVSNILSHFPESMPMLEEVVIDAPNYEPIGEGDVIPEFFLHGSAPALKSLQVRGRILWQAIPPASSLTSLIIDNTYRYRDVAIRPGTASFLQSLRYATHLQNIKAYHFLPSDAYHSPIIPLSFMSLRCLEVNDRLPYIAGFLASIKFMTACKITFLIEGSEPIPLLDQCFGALSKAWMGPRNSGRAREELQRLELHRWFPSRRTTSSLLGFFFGQGERSCEFHVQFTVGVISTQENLRNTLVAIAQPFCLISDISSLSLVDCLNAPRSIWASVIGVMPNVTSLSLTATYLSPLVEFLESGLAYPGMLPPLPALSHVQLSGPLYWASDRNVSNVTLSLAKALVKRAEMSSTTGELQLSSYRIYTDTYQRLTTLSPRLNVVGEGLNLVP